MYALAYILLLAVPWNVFGVGLVRMYFLWYILGFVTPAFWGHIPCKRVIKVAALVGWPVAACFWMRNADLLFGNWIHLTGVEARVFPIVFGNVMASFILALLVPILFAKAVSKYRLIAYMFLGKC